MCLGRQPSRLINIVGKDDFSQCLRSGDEVAWGDGRIDSNRPPPPVSQQIYFPPTHPADNGGQWPSTEGERVKQTAVLYCLSLPSTFFCTHSSSLSRVVVTPDRLGLSLIPLPLLFLSYNVGGGVLSTFVIRVNRQCSTGPCKEDFVNCLCYFRQSRMELSHTLYFKCDQCNFTCAKLSNGPRESIILLEIFSREHMSCLLKQAITFKILDLMSLSTLSITAKM